MNRLAVVFTLGALFVASATTATQRDIYFGGENNSPAFGYSPINMDVNVGDTIVWHGDFAMHPLASFAIPDGATAFASSTGTTYSYVVPMEGTFRYRCLAHSTPDGQGMAGMFTAGTAGVRSPDPAITSSVAVPNPVMQMNSTMIHVQLAKRTHLNLAIYDEKGNKVATAMDEDKDAGMQMITVDVSTLPSGSYSYVLSTPDGVLRNGLVIEK